MIGWKKFIAAALLVVVSCSAVAPENVTAAANKFAIQDDKCMASAIYYEARGEPLAGRKAVQEVILNRSQATGKTVCAVVKERAQFSWWPEKPIRQFDDELKWMLHEVKTAAPVLKDDSYKFFYSGKKRPSWARQTVCRIIAKQTYCNEKE